MFVFVISHIENQIVIKFGKAKSKNTYLKAKNCPNITVKGSWREDRERWEMEINKIEYFLAQTFSISQLLS